MPFRFSNGSSSLGKSRKESEEACREVLGTVEKEVNESQEFVDRAEKLLAKMGVLEVRGRRRRKAGGEEGADWGAGVQTGA